LDKTHKFTVILRGNSNPGNGKSIHSQGAVDARYRFLSGQKKRLAAGFDLGFGWDGIKNDRSGECLGLKPSPGSGFPRGG